MKGAVGAFRAAVRGIPRRRTDDLGDLVQVAVRALSSALADGDEKHPPGSWMTETFGHQLDHLQSHLAGIYAADDGEDHLAHLICRAVIARALKEKHK